MAMIFIDPNTGKVVEPQNNGVVGFISWTRLIAALRTAGEFRPNETVTLLQIEDRGITYHVRVNDQLRDHEDVAP
jgi:hypothetical protein